MLKTFYKEKSKGTLMLAILIFGIGLFALPDIAHAGWLTDAVGDVVSIFIAPIAILVLKILSLYNMLAGLLLNYVINKTVVNMSANYAGISAIGEAWSTIRDVANMGFIFVLLYASIQMILGIGKDTRKLIVDLIIAALLINFSFFLTSVIIDASNIIALTFYNAIAPGQTEDIMTTGLSNALMAPLSLSSIWKAAGGLDMSNIATIGVMGSIVTLIATFVFLAIALMFIIRYVVLIIVLILSPIAVVASVFPGLNTHWSDWKRALFGQAFFAPVYMLLTWITIKIFQGMSTPTSSWSEVTQGIVVQGQNAAGQAIETAKFDPTVMSLVMNFIVVIVFLIATLILSKKVADSAGMGINKLTSKALGVAGGATLGMAGRFGRGTVGRFGAGVASSERLKDMVDKGEVGGMAARLAMAAGEKTSKKSFDLRGSALGDSLEGGKAKSGGFAKDEERRQKAEIARAKSLKPSDVVLGRAAAAESSTNERLEEVRKNTYTQSAASVAAIQAAKDALDDTKIRKLTESNSDWETRRAGAEAKLREEEAAETRARESAEADSQEFKQAKFEADEAKKAHETLKEKVKTRPANYATSKATDIFGTKGAGGEIGARLRTEASKIKESELGKRKGVLGYLTRKVAGGITIVGRSAGLRQEEREAQANAVRKGIREKTKEEKALDAMTEAAKERLEKEEREKKDNTPEDSGKK